MLNKKIPEKLRLASSNPIKTDEPMSLHTSFRIGGPADYFVETNSLDELIKLVRASHKLSIPVFVIGGGTNLLVSDKGIEGLVIKNNCRKLDVLSMKGREAYVVSESGTLMSQLIRFTLDQGMRGLEHSLGLPGTVGGAVFMNASSGFSKAWVSNSFESAKILTKKGEVKEVDHAYFKFDYKTSVVQETGEIVLSVVFKFLPEDKENLWQKAKDALNYRTFTQPKGLSAGCSFRNIPLSEAMRLSTSEIKTSAGYLIDKAGLKGKRIGDAMISSVHANFIMNMGEAKAHEVASLMNIMKEEVFKKFGVNLKLEVRVVGRG